MLTVIASFLFLGVLCSIYYVFIYPFYLSPLRYLPEPDGAKFPWGHAYEIGREHNGAPFRRWINSVPNKGLIRVRVLLNQERLFLTSTEALKEVLVTDSYSYRKPPQPVFLFRKLLGNGILVAEGQDHKRQRKALMPAFSFRHIKDLYPLFWSKAQQAIQEISKANRASLASASRERRPQAVYDWASRATLDIIGQASIGHDFDSVSNPDSELLTTYRELFENEPPHFRWSVLGIYTPLELVFSLPLPMFIAIKKSAGAIRNFALDVVRNKRLSISKGSSTDIDILSIAMKSGQFSDGEVVDQLMTFLAAGHETTASAFTWAIYQLCNRSDVQDRLRTEIRTLMPSSPGEDAESTTTASAAAAAAAQVDRLPYLNAFCNELLRFIPSVPVTTREAARDTTICGQAVPKGTRIFISPWALNTSVDLWGEDALTFDPDRWLAPGSANSGGAASNYANLTFLHGPRSCIGKDFARSELLCLLAAFLGKFKVGWHRDLPLPPDIVGWVTVHPEHKLPVVFEEIDGLAP